LWGERGELGGVSWAYSVEALRGSPLESVVPHAEPRHGAEGHLHLHVVECTGPSITRLVIRSAGL
jgi:hypothetical protein